MKSILDQPESRDDVAAEDAPKDGRVEDFVGEDAAGGGGEGAVLEAVHDGEVRAGRADFELEGELEDVLLGGERDVEDVFLLRLDGLPALALDGRRDDVAMDLVASLEEETDFLGLRREKPALAREPVGP